MQIVLEDKHRVVLKEKTENGEFVYTLININLKKFTRKKLFKTMFIDFKQNNGTVISYSAKYSDGVMYQTSLFDKVNNIDRVRTNLGVTVSDTMIGLGAEKSPLKEPGIMDRFIKLANNAELEYERLKETINER